MAVVSIVTRLVGAREVEQGIKSIGTAVMSLDKGAAALSKTLTTVGGRISRTGTLLSVGLTAPIGLATAALFKFGADVVEGENLFEVSMGRMAADARVFSVELRNQLGLNEFEVRNMIGVFNQMTTSMGLSTETAFEVSKALTHLTFDMASFFNLRPEETFQKLQAGITGEVEPLKRLGIVINETTVQTLALREGVIKSGETLSESQKVLLRFAEITRQTANAQGDLARTIDSPANQMRVLQSQTKQLIQDFSVALLPAATAVIGAFKALLVPVRSLVDGFAGLSPQMKGVTVVAIGALAALGPLAIVFGKLVQAIGFAINALLALTSPLGLVLTAVGALAVGVGLLVRSWDEARVAVTTAVDDMKIGVLTRIDAMLAGLEGFVARFLGIDDDLSAARERIRNLIDETAVKQNILRFTSVGDAFSDLVSTMRADVEGIVNRTVELFGSMFQTVGEGATISVEEIKEQMRAAADAALEEAKNAEKGVKALAQEQKAAVKEIDSLTSKIGDLQKALVDTDFKSFANNISLVNEALKRGVITQEEHLALLEQLRGKFFDTFNDSPFKEYEAQIRSANEALKDHLITQEQHGQILDTIRDKQRDTFDDSQAVRFRTEIDRITEAERVGILTAAEADRLRSEANKKRIEEYEREHNMILTTGTLFQKLGLTVEGIADRIAEAFGNVFTRITEGTFSLTETVTGLFKGMIDSIIQEFIRLAATKVFRVLFGESQSVGLGIGQSLTSGGGGLVGSALGAGGLSGGLLPGGVGGLQSLALGLPGYGGGIFSLGGGAAASSLGGAASAAGVAPVAGGLTNAGIAPVAGIGGILGPGLAGGAVGVLGPQLLGFGGSGTGSVAGSLAGGAIGTFIAPGIGTAIGAGIGGFIGAGIESLVGDVIGDFLGDIFGGLFATGGSFVTQGPKLIGVGEAGPERVTVTPFGTGSVGEGGTTIVLQGINSIDQMSLGSFQRSIEQATNRTNNRRIA